MDKISIVVAVYNAENTLKKCVDSLLSQTYGNTEIILVNDCSKDESLNICNEYASQNNNVIVVNNPQNQGVSATRNNGIDVASGKYICFVDSDDYVENNYLEQLHYYAEKYNTVPICGFTYHDEFNHQKPVKYQWSGGDELVSLGESFRLNRELYLTALWNKLFLLDPIKKYGIKFDTSISIGEDLRFSVEYFEKCNLGEVYAFTATLYHYMKISDTNLFSNFIKDIENGYGNLKSIYELEKKYNKKADYDFDCAMKNQKENYCYHIMRDNSMSEIEKIRLARSFIPDFCWKDYLKHKLNFFKEKVVRLSRYANNGE